MNIHHTGFGDFAENPKTCIGCVIQDALIVLSGERQMMYKVCEVCPDCLKERNIESFGTFLEANYFIMDKLKNDTPKMNYRIEQMLKISLN